MKSPRPRSEFGASLLRAQEDDRRRLARELHSTAAQHLAALQLNLSMVEQSANTLDRRARAALADSIDLVRTCAREIRSVSYRLHPPLLDEFGLIAALRAFAEEYAQRTGAEIALDLPSWTERLPGEVEAGIFRILQDGFGVILSGGPAKVRVKRDASRVIAEVSGKGPIRAQSTIVLTAIRERARQLKGRLVLRSARDGVRLHLSVPLRSRSSKDASA